MMRPLPENQASETQAAGQGQPVVNDFCITVATVNGSGSQTSNLTLMRAMMKMGITVSGKNLFPSNIQGQPTWFTIRINQDGFTARREHHDIVVAMNPDSFARDVQSVRPGGALYYPDNIKIPVERTDITRYPMPVQKLARESSVAANLRDYIANMVYVGVLVQHLGLDMEMVRQALDFHFKGKQKPVEINLNVVKAGAAWAAQNLPKMDPFQVKAVVSDEKYIMVDGNTAAALGALYGGLQFVAWYPITPASSLAETIMEYAPKLRKDPETGKTTCVVVQAEDELAAVGMTVGAGWAGLRSMTSTSGPGLSLMAEYVGLAYFTEVPLVIWDIQRVGPATGLPTRTAQADLTFTSFMSHGDTRHVILLPGSINEVFDFGWQAFDLAEQLQTPIFVLSDLDFGMNSWMAKPFQYPEKHMERGKVLWEGDLDRLNGEWSRYLDKDDDGIPYRTLPGNRHPRSAYFTRGTGHDEQARYTEDPQKWENMLNRLAKKFETACKYLPAPVVDAVENAGVGIIAYGSSDPAVQEARYLLRDRGMHTGYLRLRSIPFHAEVGEFIRSHARVYVVEQNRDGQMKQLLSVEYPELAGKLVSLAHIDGLPLSTDWVLKELQAKEEKVQ